MSITDSILYSPQVFVWIGDGANEVEKAEAVTVAMVKLKIIPRARVGYEIINSQRGVSYIISYPTTASRVTVLSKTPAKYVRKLK